MTRPLADRFWEKVQRTEDGCWPWTGATYPFGYGAIGRGHMRVEAAHRVSWELHHGPIPAGLKVLHRCDNPPCVNPEHLFLGTQADNMRDKQLKGRARKRLTTAQVVDILARHTESHAALAREYGVTRQAVYWVRKQARMAA